MTRANAGTIQADRLKRRLPLACDEALEVTLETVRVNLLAERWDAAREAIHRLEHEAATVRCWQWPLERRLAASPEEIGVSVRTSNALARAGVLTLAELLRYDRQWLLLNVRNFGDAAIVEIKRCLARAFRYNFKLVAAWPEGS